MARVSREKAAQNRAHVVEVAARQFREHGLDGIGIAELMKAAGLTHGGFYANFASKDALAAEAVGAARQETAERLRAVAAAAPDPLAAVADFYLSPEHRDGRADGCVLAALAGDGARKDGAVRTEFDGTVAGYLERLVPLMGGADVAEKRERALAALATLVGSLMLARAVEAPELAEGLLDAGRAQVKKLGVGA